MRLWQINTPEATPADHGQVRLRRAGLFADAAVERGHEILWWSAAFFHANKKYRASSATTVEVADGYRIHYLHGPGYRRNVSFARLWDHHVVARQFSQAAEKEPAPDMILCSCPTLDLSLAAVRFGRRHGIPVVLDVRDLWPDVFVEAAPSGTRTLAKWLLQPYYRMAVWACREATAIVGNSPAFVEWGVRMAGREASSMDRDFPFGYQEPFLDAAETESADAFWQARQVETDPEIPVICFFGTVGFQFSFDVALCAARAVLKTHDARFVFCGDGDRREELETATSDEPRIIFPGWVNAAQIWRLMQRSRLALAPYNVNANFRDNLTNKPIEYLAGGLPILYSIDESYVGNLLRQFDCGITYGNDANRLAQSIRELLDTPDRLARMGCNARSLFEERYRAPDVYGEMVDHMVQIASVPAREEKRVEHCPVES